MFLEVHLHCHLNTVFSEIMVENWDGWYDKWYPKPRPFVVPDYRIYKVEGVQELEYVRDTLAKRGLKDPWLR